MNTQDQSHVAGAPNEAAEVRAAVDDGGPAFPVPEHMDNWGTTHVTQNGMTLRDYFAAKAMPVAFDYGCMTVGNWPGYESVAASAYAMADAMLRARAE